MQIIEVNNNSIENEFILIGYFVNKNNSSYIRPLDSEMRDVFNPLKNKNFQYGKANRWIIKNGNETIGRIAAFITSKYICKGTDYLVGGVGFFECINSQDAANMLFNAAKEWLLSHNCEAMDGPINFGDRDKWWGLLVEGFNEEPIYGMPYNPTYYKNLFEGYGFKNYYNQYWYTMSVDDPLPPRFQERFARFSAKPDYVAKHIDLKDLPKYANDFATVYNAAWAQHGEAKEITVEEVLKLFNTMKPIMDARVVWFAYYKKEPIAMFINVPDVNQYFKHFNGKFGWLQKLQLLWMKYNGQCKKLTGLAFGVVPKYQALGIDSFLIQACGNKLQNKGWYNSYEMGWSGDWNPRMINIYKSLGGSQSRTMITYRFIFDETKHTFEKHPILEYK